MQLDHQLEKDLATKFFCSSHDEDHEVAWSQKPTVYKTQQLLEEDDELGHMSPIHNMLMKNVGIQVHHL